MATAIPQFTLASLERSRWDIVPQDLVGRVVDNLEELQILLPEDETNGEVYLSRHEDGKCVFESLDLGFDRYSRRYKPFDPEDGSEDMDVAHGCPKCEKIVIGPPKIKESIGKGVNCNCGNCNANIKNTRGVYD